MTLTHPGDKGRVDLDAVFKACEETGTYLEISNRHRQLTVEEIRIAAKYDVKFIIGSDAHVPQRVGTCENAVRRIIEAGTDEKRIVNLIHDI
jgi:putative hydrolase